MKKVPNSGFSVVQRQHLNKCRPKSAQKRRELQDVLRTSAYADKSTLTWVKSVFKRPEDPEESVGVMLAKYGNVMARKIGTQKTLGKVALGLAAAGAALAVATPFVPALAAVAIKGVPVAMAAGGLMTAFGLTRGIDHLMKAGQLKKREQNARETTIMAASFMSKKANYIKADLTQSTRDVEMKLMMGDPVSVDDARFSAFIATERPQQASGQHYQAYRSYHDPEGFRFGYQDPMEAMRRQRAEGAQWQPHQQAPPPDPNAPTPADFAKLGLRPEASLKEVKAARREILRAHHPDRNRGDAAAEARYKAASAAADKIAAAKGWNL